MATDPILEIELRINHQLAHEAEFLADVDPAVMAHDADPVVMCFYHDGLRGGLEIAKGILADVRAGLPEPQDEDA